MSPVNAPLEHLADAAEAAAFRDLVAAAPRPLADALGLRVLDIDGATALLAPRVPDVFFNRVIGLGVERPATEAGLDRLVAAYRDAGVRAWWVHATPGAEPAALAEWLRARGFAPPARRTWAKMVRGTAPAPSVDTDVEIREVRPSEANAVGTQIAAAFGMPPPFAGWIAALAGRPGWRMFGAFAGGPIGGACLHLQGERAWLGIGGVRADARGRGAHRALMAARLQAAIDAGCRWIVTETGEPVGDERNPSLANMVRCGFERACSRMNYAAPAPSP